MKLHVIGFVKIGPGPSKQIIFSYLTDILMGDWTAPPTLPLDPPVIVIVSPLQWRIQGRGLGAQVLPLLLDQTEARKAENFFFETEPSLISGSG